MPCRKYNKTSKKWELIDYERKGAEMPMDRKRYPKDWSEIAFKVKSAADWKCQICGVQCYRPGEKVEDHGRILTVMHLNHTPEDCRPDNLLAGCARCHLKYDAQHHAETRRQKGTRQTSLNL